MTCEPRFTAVMPTGARIDLFAPDPKRIWIVDIADTLARMPADPHIHTGYYSLAQRSVLLAQAAGREEGALAGLYALLVLSPFAPVPALPWLAPASRPPVHAQILCAVHTALELDPPPPAIALWIDTLQLRIRLSELMVLRRGVAVEIAEMETAGIRPLVGRIATLGFDAARDRYLATFKTFATQAALRKTPAWSGIH